MLLQATVKPSEIKVIPQPVVHHRAQYLAPSLPIESMCWGHSPFLLLRKSLQVIIAGLVDTKSISSKSQCSSEGMRWQNSSKKCLKTN